MKNRTLRTAVLVFLCLLLCCPLKALADEIIDPAREASLTLHYTRGEQAFENLEISIHRVGEVFANNTYALVEPYSGYPVDIQGLASQKEWQDAATTLKACVTQSGQAPLRTALTDSTGTVAFAGLQTGLYLICGVTCETETETCTFGDFLLFLPRNVEGTYVYQVDAQPKFSSADPKPQEEYSVLKLWQDGEDPQNRPLSVTVDILKNGQLHETVVLSQENNWFYAWTAPAGAQWTVAERDVPEGYTVTVSNNQTAFVITNTEKPDIPDDPGTPDTGDTAPLLLYILLTSLSGLGLLLLGVALLRGKHHGTQS